jgi:acetyltransferase-like isoleucine patch superfamily enzyme
VYTVPEAGFPSDHFIYTAQADIRAAYNLEIPADLTFDYSQVDLTSNVFYSPGVYSFASNTFGATFSRDIILSGTGNFVFVDIVSLFIVNGVTVQLDAAVSPSCVFFRVRGNAYIGGTLNGIVIAEGDITIGANAKVNGALFSMAGTVTLGPNSKVVQQPQCGQCFPVQVDAHEPTGIWVNMIISNFLRLVGMFLIALHFALFSHCSQGTNLYYDPTPGAVTSVIHLSIELIQYSSMAIRSDLARAAGNIPEVRIRQLTILPGGLVLYFSIVKKEYDWDKSAAAAFRNLQAAVADKDSVLYNAGTLGRTVDSPFILPLSTICVDDITILQPPTMCPQCNTHHHRLVHIVSTYRSHVLCSCRLS